LEMLQHANVLRWGNGERERRATTAGEG
jgi:hypothetical protein